ncbi:MAG: hypothetical protein AB7E70_03250 [Hyphomicrobiaceae bacterium]
MSTNATRVDRADVALRAYAYAADSADEAQAITDLVADIGHYCVAHELSYLDLLARGVSHWHLELAAPDSIDLMPEVSITINEGTHP